MKVAVLGATGFTGEKLVDILLSHRQVDLTYISSRTEEPILYSKLFPRFLKKTDLKCEPHNIEKAAALSDIIFLSLPHTVSMEYACRFLKLGKKVIDLSADYRLSDSALYKKFYKVDHSDKTNLKRAVYGLPELFRSKIKKADLIANPGCYPTSMILALYPLMKESLIKAEVIVDSKSSITGAGRKAVIDYHYSNISDNLWAYKAFNHQHTPEVIEILKAKTGKSLNLKFVPHVVPIGAGIYSTSYVSFLKKQTFSKVKALFQRYYKDEPFIRVNQELVKLKNVVGTNFCDIGFSLDETGKFGVIVSCIDNLLKGAAGAAVQNMNILLGIDEKTGL
ncbi:MAG: N-acetyl-gamma-glutamyl-phosphate reductase [Candidatus Omnitrophica bacterium]|nr:N-acetyl-gamma-glutamyl-phosphate reductase [Candidatus Omnitrophota bacterium]